MELRCHSCSHYLGETDLMARWVGLFKASQFPKLPRSHANEIRKRCAACGCVNVFHPVNMRRVVELKTGS